MILVLDLILPRILFPSRILLDINWNSSECLSNRYFSRQFEETNIQKDNWWEGVYVHIYIYIRIRFFTILYSGNARIGTLWTLVMNIAFWLPALGECPLGEVGLQGGTPRE